MNEKMNEKQYINDLMDKIMDTAYELEGISALLTNIATPYEEDWHCLPKAKLGTALRLLSNHLDSMVDDLRSSC